LTEQQWRELAGVIESRKLVPLVDFAYQGLGEGIEPDAVALQVLAERDTPLLCTSSCSKNFGLYNERVGALSVVTESPDETDRVLGNLKAIARANYSNPPAHGAGIVSTIVSDDALRANWEQELTEMRDRIQSVREEFTRRLAETGVDRDFSFITKQRGMFSITGLSREQIGTLRDEYSIYLVGSGRINVAGINQTNIGPLCEAIAKVLKA
jgi:aspartate/tyrosine/aromatic aminotransferase